MSRQLPAGIDALLGDGDGTVPYLSAIPIELSHEYREGFIAERHEASVRLLREISIPQARKGVWLEVLGSVLAHPRKYPSIILSAALERYATLVGEEDSPILENEAVLGLPVVAKEGLEK